MQTIWKKLLSFNCIIMLFITSPISMVSADELTEDISINESKDYTDTILSDDSAVPTNKGNTTIESTNTVNPETVNYEPLQDIQTQIDYWTGKDKYSVNPVANPSAGSTNLAIGTYSTIPIYLMSFTPVLAEGTTIGWRYVSTTDGFSKNATYTVIKSGTVSAGEPINIYGELNSNRALLIGGTGIAIGTQYGTVNAAHSYLKSFYGNSKVGGGLGSKCLAGTFVFIPIEEDSRVVYDKNLVVMGDSITNLKRTRSWMTYMSNYLTFKSITEYAHDGASWRNFSDTEYDITDYADSSHNNTIYNQINKLKYATDNGTKDIPDVILILAGTNDVSNSDNIGNVATAFADTTPVIRDAVTTKLTVVESIRYCVELLRSYYPETQIIISSPLQRATYYNNVFLMRDAIKECAARLSVRFINQTDESGIDYITEANEHKYLADGLHPNAEGAELVGNYMSLELQRMIR